MTDIEFNCDTCQKNFSDETGFNEHSLFIHGVYRPICMNKLENKVSRFIEEIVFVSKGKYTICNNYGISGCGGGDVIFGLIESLKKDGIDYKKLPMYKSQIKPFICEENHYHTPIDFEKYEKEITDAFKMAGGWIKETEELIKYKNRLRIK